MQAATAVWGCGAHPSTGRNLRLPRFAFAGSRQAALRRRTVELSMLSLVTGPAIAPIAAAAPVAAKEASVPPAVASSCQADAVSGMKGRRLADTDIAEGSEPHQMTPEACQEGPAEDESGSDSESDSSGSSSSSSSSSEEEEEEGGRAWRAAPQQLTDPSGYDAMMAEGRAAGGGIEAQMEADCRGAEEQRKATERAAKARRKEENRLAKQAAAARAQAEADAGQHSSSELPVLYPRAASSSQSDDEQEGEGNRLSWLLGQLLR